MIKPFIIYLSLTLSLAYNIAFAETTTKSHGFAVYGDLKYPKDFKNFDYVNPNAPKGGKVKTASIGTFDNLNPFILKGVPASSISLIFDTLTVSSSDETASTYGLLAHTVELAEDKSYVIFHLRKIAKWHDGTSIIADDVVFSFDILKSKGHPYYKSYYKEVTDAVAIDKHTVKFNFSNPKNKELPLIVGQLPILSKAYYATNAFEKTTLQSPLGSGAYKVKSVDSGRAISFQRVQNYWAKDLAVSKGKFNFDEITVDYYRDATVAIEALKAGEYDFRRENISKNWANSYNIEQVKSGKMIKEELKDGSPTGMQAFIFNTRNSAFSNPKFREALNYAYDFGWANKNLFNGAYARNRSYFGNSEFEAKGLPSQNELLLLNKFKDDLPKRIFENEYNPPKTDGSGNNRKNLVKAKNLLKEAGFVVKNLKLIDPKTNKPIKIEFLLSSPFFERVVSPFAKDLKRLGIETVIRTVDSSQYIKRLETFDFDVTVHWFTQGNNPGNEQYDYWHSSRVETQGSKNLIGIKNPAVDFMVEKIISAQSKQELKTATKALDRILQWNFYSIPQWHSKSHRVIYWSKLKRPKNIAPYDLGLLQTWWIDDL